MYFLGTMNMQPFNGIYCELFLNVLIIRYISFFYYKIKKL